MDLTSVLLLCKQIKESGKTPSMGLIKAKSSQVLPIPLIVSGLKRFKEMSPAEIDELRTPNTQQAQNLITESKSENERIVELEREIVEIKSELKEMRTLLKASSHR
ncbi:hypothetical protein [Glaciecola sp. KUL10]|uniref:hypothetical protein n=1 Tax=Glaciecola sp. (strain KUL10) TaxID=2161813 RepID=UPI000D78A96B|nr:hypothetical protein [Glaciecola sp. KUL10]